MKLNKDELLKAVDKAGRILLTYQNKICKEYEWVDNLRGRRYDYSEREYFLSGAYGSNQIHYRANTNGCVDRSVIIDLLEEYNQKNPHNKFMVESDRFNDIIRHLEVTNYETFEMKSYHTPFLSETLTSCRCFLGLYQGEVTEKYLATFISDIDVENFYIGDVEKLLALDEKRLTTIEFCEKDRKQLIKEKLEELDEKILKKTKESFKKKSEELLRRSTPEEHRATPSNETTTTHEVDNRIPYTVLGFLIGALLTLLIF